MKALEEMLLEKRKQLEHLRIEIATLEDAVKRASGEFDAPKHKRAPRSNVKKLVLEMLDAAGEDGLNAAIAVETAKQKGEALERGTVSSLLSRLKNDGTVAYDGTKYRLTRSSEKKPEGGSEGAIESAAVFTYPASRATP